MQLSAVIMGLEREMRRKCWAKLHFHCSPATTEQVCVEAMASCHLMAVICTNRAQCVMLSPFH